MAGAPIGKAWTASLLVHALVAVALCGAWSTKSVTRTMDVAALFLSDIDNGPSPLPPIIADPMFEPVSSSTFPPIQPIGHVESNPIVPMVSNPARPFAPSTIHHSPSTIHHPPSTNHRSPPTTTTFFGLPSQGSSIVYVIDCSASMGLHGRLNRAVNEVEASLRRLPTETKFQVITYHRTIETLRTDSIPGLLKATHATIDGAVQSLKQLRAEGSADHRRALKAALALNPEVVYFLTDEDDFTPADAVELTRFNARRSCIHTICLVAPVVMPSPLATLAAQNRGQFRVADQ